MQLRDLPRAPHFQSVEAIFGNWPCWTKEVEHDLSLDLEEEKFHERYAILDDLRLVFTAKRPTLLHSSGHLDRACPCGCRQSGLSHVRLARDGISAVFVDCAHEERLRHLHPCEAAYLCSFPAHFRFPRARAALPLVGQSAAPLQAAWMLSLFRLALRTAHGLPLGCSPESTHAALQSHLLKLACHLWPTKDTQVSRPISLRFQGCDIVFEVAPGFRLEELIAAQTELGGWGRGLVVMHEGFQVPPGTILKKGCYDVVSWTLASPDTPWFYLQWQNRCWTGPLPLGITVSSLLCMVGFPARKDWQLSILGHDCSFDMPLLASFVGTLRPPTCFLGAGLTSMLGLSDHQVEAEASRMLRRAGPPTGFHFLSVLDLSALLTLPCQDAERILCSLIPADTDDLCGIYCFDGHWMAFSFDKVTAMAYHYDGLQGVPHVAQFIFETVAKRWNLPTWTLQQYTLIHQDSGSHCGVIALVNSGAYLGLWDTYSEEQALQWFAALMAPRFIGAGTVEYNKAFKLLAAELPKHGVPDGEAASRAAAALKKLGTNAILKAFEAKNVWQALKLLGNSTERPFQWVLHAELERHVQSKALDKKAPANKVRKLNEQKAKPVSLVPSQVGIPPGAFCDPQGKPLAAISLDDIGPNARGVIIVTHDQALRYIKDQKSVSIDALGLLTLSVLHMPPECKLDFAILCSLDVARNFDFF